jgi:hypothetical protein
MVLDTFARIDGLTGDFDKWSEDDFEHFLDDCVDAGCIALWSVQEWGHGRWGSRFDAWANTTDDEDAKRLHCPDVRTYLTRWDALRWLVPTVSEWCRSNRTPAALRAEDV